MRTGFYLAEQRKHGLNDAEFVDVGFLEVNTRLGGPDRYKDSLHEWAISVLSVGGYESGLYYGTYQVIQDENEPGACLAYLTVPWNGRSEVYPGHVRHTRPRLGASDAVAVLAALDRADIPHWVTGGWGLDALLGRETCAHRDLDLLLTPDDLTRATNALYGTGLRYPIRDEPGCCRVLFDAGGQEVNLYAVTRTDDGGADQSLPDGTVFHYPAPVPGIIGKRSVLCVDIETQLAHRGHNLTTDEQRAKLATLRDLFYSRTCDTDDSHPR